MICDMKRDSYAVVYEIKRQSTVFRPGKKSMVSKEMRRNVKRHLCAIVYVSSTGLPVDTHL